MALHKLSVSILLLGVLVGLGACHRKRHRWPGNRLPECKQKPDRCPESLELVTPFDSPEVLAFENGLPVLFCTHGCCGHDWRPNCCPDPTTRPNSKHHQDGRWWQERGELYEDDDDNDHHGGHWTLKIVLPVLLSVGVVAAVVVTAVCVVRRRKLARRQVASALTDHSKGPVVAASMFPSDKEPISDEPINPHAPQPIFVSGVPPPAYDLISEGGDDSSAPPTYSSLDLQAAARGSAPTPLDKDRDGPVA